MKIELIFIQCPQTVYEYLIRKSLFKFIKNTKTLCIANSKEVNIYSNFFCFSVQRKLL
jgi:hypothetical protein